MHAEDIADAGWGEKCNFVVTAGFRRYHYRLMIKALLLIFEPVDAWERVARAQRSIAHICVVFLLPLFVLTSVVEGYGLHQWGKMQGDGIYRKFFNVPEAIVFEAGQMLLSFAVVFIGAKVIKSLGETFHGRHTYSQAFRAVAYGLSPMFTLRLLDALPAISPWISWAIGILLTVAILYQGVPRIMLPDPPHAFGLYLISSILLVLITGLARFLTAWYLLGKFQSVEKIISDLIARVTS